MRGGKRWISGAVLEQALQGARPEVGLLLGAEPVLLAVLAGF